MTSPRPHTSGRFVHWVWHFKIWVLVQRQGPYTKHHRSRVQIRELASPKTNVGMIA